MHRNRRVMSMLVALAAVAMGGWAAEGTADEGSIQAQLDVMKQELDRLRGERAEWQALQAEVSQLRAETNEGWLNERRAEQVKSLIHDVLADADTCASLAGDGIIAGHNGKKFFLASEDGKFLMNIAGQIQIRYIWNSREESEAIPEPTRALSTTSKRLWPARKAESGSSAVPVSLRIRTSSRPWRSTAARGPSCPRPRPLRTAPTPRSVVRCSSTSMSSRSSRSRWVRSWTTTSSTAPPSPKIEDLLDARRDRLLVLVFGIAQSEQEKWLTGQEGELRVRVLSIGSSGRKSCYMYGGSGGSRVCEPRRTAVFANAAAGHAPGQTVQLEAHRRGSDLNTDRFPVLETLRRRQGGLIVHARDLDDREQTAG